MPAPAFAGAGELASQTELISDSVYLGTVKSYNDRRGFGFIACAETLASYGRDVYMAKAEVQQAGEAGNHGFAEHGRGGKYIAETHAALRIAEEDVVRFQVRLSVEGYPQAANVQRLRKYRGIVLHPPPEDNGCTGTEDDAGTVVSEELMRALGDREASLKRADCGQASLSTGDEVTFCVPEVPKGRGDEGTVLEAKQVVLLKTNRFSRAILGCFSLKLPRPRVGHHRTQRKDLRVDCHAFNDRIIIAGLPGDCDESELRRFFSKQGATDTIATRARGCGFASVSFPSMSEVAKLLSRTAHAFTDDKETQIATLSGRRVCSNPHGDTPRLPALPVPSLMPGEVVGNLLVNWSPLVLAVGYIVELRPAGVRASWSTVDSATGCLKSGGTRFDKDRSSCKVTGLDAASSYEARVTYFTSCGCKAEASDTSERCIPCPGTRMVPTGAGMLGQAMGAHMGMLPGAGLGMGASQVFGNCWQGNAAASTALAPMHVQASQSWSVGMGLPGSHCQPCVPQQPQPLQGLVGPTPTLLNSESAGAPGAGQASGWRCVHGAVIPPPPVPEVYPADECGFAVSVQWPSVAHAAAYVVELREANSPHVERFMRSAPMATRGSIVELRVGGLRPGGPPGQRYAAQVRCIAECGCESAPSTPGWSPVLGASSQPSQGAAAQATPAGPMLPAIAPTMQDTGAPSPLSTLAAGAPALLPSPMQEQHSQQPQAPTSQLSTQQSWMGFTQPEAYVTAVGMPSWVTTMQSVGTVQPNAVALYSQAPDQSPTAADSMGAQGPTATLAAAMAASDISVALGASLASVVRPDQEMPPELTGCEECLLLD